MLKVIVAFFHHLFSTGDLPDYGYRFSFVPLTKIPLPFWDLGFVVVVYVFTIPFLLLDVIPNRILILTFPQFLPLLQVELWPVRNVDGLVVDWWTFPLFFKVHVSSIVIVYLLEGGFFVGAKLTHFRLVLLFFVLFWFSIERLLHENVQGFRLFVEFEKLFELLTLFLPFLLFFLILLNFPPHFWMIPLPPVFLNVSPCFLLDTLLFQLSFHLLLLYLICFVFEIPKIFVYFF